MSKNYLGVEDLLCDESFLSWYFKTDAQSISQWEQWILANPDSYDRIERAVGFLQTLPLREKAIAAEQITMAERLLLERIYQAERRKINVIHPVIRPYKKQRWMAAASVILLAGSLIAGYRWLTKNPELRTAYGQIMNQKLPDGTEVVVNANSNLRYSTNWKDGKDREVWLNGEAFFHVMKTPLKSRFIVHTDHFDIMVTGTQFNVVNRKDKANVMLKEGSVILYMAEGKEVKMKPGDFVEFDKDQLEKRPVKNDSVVAWKDHKLLFDNTPLKEVVKIINEHYGIPVILGDEETGEKTISGILPNNNLDVFLQSLEALDFEIVRQGDSVTIRKHD
ncbi:FecR family protein [Flavitalea flava]